MKWNSNDLSSSTCGVNLKTLGEIIQDGPHWAKQVSKAGLTALTFVLVLTSASVALWLILLVYTVTEILPAPS